MNDTAILQQLTAANLALTTTVTMLTATNKKLIGAAARAKGGGTLAVLTNPERGVRATQTMFPGNYCWMHGHHCNKHHTSATCGNKAVGHCNDATALNTMDGSTRDKGWDRVRT